MGKFLVEFGPRATAKLDELAIEAGLSKPQVVRRALDVYTEVFNALYRDGKRLLLQDPTGEEEGLLLW
jgi:hypothetical protein